MDYAHNNLKFIIRIGIHRIKNYMEYSSNNYHYNKFALRDNKPSDVDIHLDYERKYRYLRTIHCEDTDFKCMENKLKVLNK